MEETRVKIIEPKQKKTWLWTSIVLLSGTILATGLGVGLSRCNNPSVPTSLELSAITSNATDWNKGTLIEKEISFNNYQNKVLTIKTKQNIKNTITWKYSPTLLEPFVDITEGLTTDSGLGLDSDGNVLTLDASGDNTFKRYDFYLEASIEDMPKLIPEPIHIKFHNAVSVGDSGCIITTAADVITNFAANQNLKNDYDTIYIPPNIEEIGAGVFFNTFDIQGSCKGGTWNIIFADHPDETIITDGQAFCSNINDSSMSFGDIYIGTGTISYTSNNGYQSGLFVCGLSGSNIVAGDVTIKGNLEFENSSTSASFLFAAGTLTVNNVNIVDSTISLTSPTNGVRFFSTNSSSINIGDVYCNNLHMIFTYTGDVTRSFFYAPSSTTTNHINSFVYDNSSTFFTSTPSYPIASINPQYVGGNFQGWPDWTND